jgi:hypothetical protein
LDETNPTKLEKIRKKNLKNLIPNLDLIFDAITSSIIKPTNVCPAYVGREESEREEREEEGEGMENWEDGQDWEDGEDGRMERGGWVGGGKTHSSLGRMEDRKMGGWGEEL